MLAERPHRRRNLLTGEWVLVSPHRTGRPWQGRVEAVADEGRPSHDPTCYLCPGNTRAGGESNPAYAGTYAFTNDFAALAPDTPDVTVDEGGLLQARSEPGTCRVLCFSPRHDLTLAELSLAAVRDIVDLWADEYRALGARPDIGHVQIFENKGELMGCSNPHPHGQVWAQRSVPVQPALEGNAMLAHHQSHGRTLLADYLALELEREERIVCANDSFVALVPFWAFWPFETLIVSREPRESLLALSGRERDDFADVIRQVTVRYDNLFETSFPYSAGIHQAPTDGQPHPEWHLHMHFFPPLLRSATVKKFEAGYELFAEQSRDITPEASAERLRTLSDVHYRGATIRVAPSSLTHAP